MEKLVTTPTKPTGEKIDINAMHDFYTWKRDPKNAGILIKLDMLKTLRLLMRLGFYRYDVAGGGHIFVRITDNRINTVTAKTINDSFDDYIKALPVRELDLTKPANQMDESGEAQIKERITPDRILEMLYNSDRAKLNGLFDRLRPDSPIQLMEDDKLNKYLYFRNTIVHIDAKGIKMMPYTNNLPGYIWESSIVDRDFNYTDRVGDFEQFCRNICNPTDKQRFRCLMSVIGYLMHNNFECTRKAVLFTDVNKDNVGKASGGTGKGLIGKALGYTLNRNPKEDCKYVSIAGKRFDPTTGNGTCYSLADATTQLIHIEDLSERFDFEHLFNDITDGATMRKNYDRQPTVKDVKFMLSVNHTINISGSSKSRRICLFELTNFYDHKHIPEDDFKRRFFESDWEQADWDQFYSFMCRCAMEYMKSGLLEPERVNYDNRRLEEYFENNKDFMYWFREKIADVLKQQDKTPVRVVLNKAPIFEEYKHDHPNVTIEQKWFTKWCKAFLDIKGIPYCEKRSTQDQLIINPCREDRG